MIGRDHDPDLGSRFTLRLAGLAIAAGNASAQVVVPDICQFGALEDPEDRPPRVVDTMLSGSPYRKVPESPMITSRMSTMIAVSPELSGNRAAMCGYRADPRKCCHTASALDILVFPQSPGRWMAAGQKNQLGAPFPA